MNMAEMSAQDRYDLEKYHATERARERARKIAYQRSLGPVKTWQEREMAEQDLFDSLWKRGMAPRTY
jgi:hypothetical protein